MFHHASLNAHKDFANAVLELSDAAIDEKVTCFAGRFLIHREIYRKFFEQINFCLSLLIRSMLHQYVAPENKIDICDQPPGNHLKIFHLAEFLKTDIPAQYYSAVCSHSIVGNHR
jgi:hypothetical protein